MLLREMKRFIGKVKSCKMQKTVVVTVTTQRPHPLYKKLVKKTKNYKVHNENLDLKVGDIVKFVETRPISKDKKWKVTEKVEV